MAPVSGGMGSCVRTRVHVDGGTSTTTTDNFNVSPVLTGLVLRGGLSSNSRGLCDVGICGTSRATVPSVVLYGPIRRCVGTGFPNEGAQVKLCHAVIGTRRGISPRGQVGGGRWSRWPVLK